MARIAEQLRRHGRLAGVIGVLALLVLWIASGTLTREPEEVRTERAARPMAVGVNVFAAEPVERLLTLQGRVEPDQRVNVRAETAGQVDQWHVRLGAMVEVGELLTELRIDDREARRRQALAQLRGAENDHAATLELQQQGLASRTDVEGSLARVEAARAELEAVEIDIRNTRITAPVAGVINERIAERGDFVSVGDAVAEIVDNNPLLAVVQVAQHQIMRVQPGQPARVHFLDGRLAEGEVRFVSTVAQPGTQTFRVEVEIPNPDGALPSGISATLEIPTEVVEAHKLSPAVMALDAAGRVGVKTVDDDSLVQFHAVDVIRAAPDGMWVVGLPQRVRVITVGHGFVSAGERVIARPEQGALAADDAALDDRRPATSGAP